MKATIALAVRMENGVPSLQDVLSDSREIMILESALNLGDENPLKRVYDQREKQHREDEDFSDYVEELLTKPFLKADIQQHGVRWLKSKIKIEKYRQSEIEAANVIAEYAMAIFRSDHQRTDFMLAGPSAEVRIRIFILNNDLDNNSEAA